MKQVLFIRPDANVDGKIEWCVSGSQQVATLESRDALRTLAVNPLATRVCLLLPASEMVFRHFTLPKKGLSTASTPFSWLAEETLIGDVDSLRTGRYCGKKGGKWMPWLLTPPALSAGLRCAKRPD